MKLLVLGGTKFLGRHIVEAALAREHEVTLFNRGQSNPELFPGVEKLRGDRDGDLSRLEGRRWDAVVDPSGYVPRVVRASADLLADAVDHYTFVSSVSVYADFSRGWLDEQAPLIELEDAATEDVAEHYGGLKALCERAVEDALPGNLIVRPGLIVGPDDPTGRFTYWPHRVARGGDVLAPGEPERPVQFIDVRDLAAWIVAMVERRATGVFNATGPEPRPTMGELLETCKRVTCAEARLVWVPDRFLLERGVGEWMELPLWVAAAEWQGLMAADVSRAVAAGLRSRPLAETVQGALEHAVPTDAAGLKRDREAELLEAWAARA